MCTTYHLRKGKHLQMLLARSMFREKFPSVHDVHFIENKDDSHSIIIAYQNRPANEI
ncbi:MAG: hypothetical protein ACLP5H_03105 [Desulfomonilaceae bacterium]